MNKFEVKLTIETPDVCIESKLNDFILLALKDSVIFGEGDKIEILSIIQVCDSD